MSRDQNAGRSHNVRMLIVPLKGCNVAEIWDQNIHESIFFSGRNYEQVEVREFLLSFSTEYFVFHFAVQK